MNSALQQMVRDCQSWTDKGKVADYIPELSKANPSQLGVSITQLDGTEFYAGNSRDLFTIQSISKVSNFLLALEDKGYEALKHQIGVLPTIRGFNSILELDIENEHKPLNPFINAGAMVTLTFIKGKNNDEKFSRVINFMSQMMGEELSINEAVYQSERETGNRNRALAYYMKSTGILTEDVESLLDLYFKICSVQVHCGHISRFAAVLANQGRDLNNEMSLIKPYHCRVAKAIMANCGMYDASGEFAVKVGLPAKSGVGGGIMAIASGKMGIGVMGPALDTRGNSMGGWQLLERISDHYQLSIY